MVSPRGGDHRPALVPQGRLSWSRRLMKPVWLRVTMCGMSIQTTDSTVISAAAPPRWAVWAAHLTTWVVLPSGLWRIALVLGYPAGYSDVGFESFQTVGAKVWMLSLSVLCELAAFLTIGLVRPWGEVVPHWIPLIGGRTVRPMAAVVPAALGAAARASPGPSTATSSSQPTSSWTGRSSSSGTT